MAQGFSKSEQNLIFGKGFVINVNCANFVEPGSAMDAS